MNISEKPFIWKTQNEIIGNHYQYFTVYGTDSIRRFYVPARRNIYMPSVRVNFLSTIQRMTINAVLKILHKVRPSPSILAHESTDNVSVMRFSLIPVRMLVIDGVFFFLLRRTVLPNMYTIWMGWVYDTEPEKHINTPFSIVDGTFSRRWKTHRIFQLSTACVLWVFFSLFG